MAIPSAPTAPPPAQPLPGQPFPSQPYYWYAPPAQPPKDDSKLVILIVVIVLVLIIVPIVLAAVLYVMVTGLVGPQGPTPTISLRPAISCGAGCSELVVLVATEDVALAGFTVRFLVNGTVLATTTLRPGILHSDGQYTLSFVDLNTSGTLDAGDSFRLLNNFSQADCLLTVEVRNTAFSTGWTC